MKENKQSLRNLCDIFKYTNILIMGVPEGEEGEWNRKKIEDTVGENLQKHCEKH